MQKRHKVLRETNKQAIKQGKRKQTNKHNDTTKKDSLVSGQTN